MDPVLEISVLESPPVSSLPLELVERKGLGHPDTLCDALAENLSRVLCAAYLERFGVILHHNVDKALLRGGAARPAFGGGEVLEPIELYLCGRATLEAGGLRVPVEELAVEGTRQWLRAHLRWLDVETDLRIVPLLRPTSSDLSQLFSRRATRQPPLANDTSLGVGFAPLDALERTVLEVERHLSSDEVRRQHPELGEDVKVMGVRHHAHVSLTVACAMVGRFLTGPDDYRRKKQQLSELIAQRARPLCPGPLEVVVNAADDEAAGSFYLTVTGLSAEAGDDGEVGRGNRVNGLITPYRPMVLEAAAGKNPITHVGKLYNLVAQRISEGALRWPGVEEAGCALVSRIGRPITLPLVVDLKVRLPDPAALPQLRPRLTDLVRAELAALPELWRSLVDGSLSIC